MSLLPEWTNLRLFEQMPAERVWEIIERLPDVALELALPSNALQSVVDRLLLTIKISRYYYEISVISDNGSMSVEMRISMDTSDWWALLVHGLALRAAAPALCSVSRSCADDLVAYKCSWDSSDPDVVESVLDGLNGLLCQSFFERTTLVGSDASALVKLLKGAKVNRLKLASFTMSDVNIIPLMEFIKEHKLDHLKLSVDEITLSDPVNLLLALSTQCKSIHIVQGNCSGKIGNDALHFFGLHNADWGPIIVDMFRGEMNKLCIENAHFPNYMKKKCVNILRKRVPSIGKGVWFEATCVWGIRVLDCTLYHIMDVINPPNGNRSITIKHCYRLNETIDETFSSWDNESYQQAGNELMRDILGMRTLRSFDGSFFQVQTKDSGANWEASAALRNGAWSNFLIAKRNEQIVIKANCSRSLQHLGVRYLSAHPNGSVTLVASQTSRELWTPIKNTNKSWSLRSSRDTWLALCADGRVRQQINRGVETEIRTANWFS